jgi:hypothetical protein
MRQEMASDAIGRITLMLIAAALFCFNPLRLALWPESGAYYMDLLQVLLFISVVGFPVAGSVMLDKAIPQATTSLFSALRTTLLVSLPVGSIALWFIIMLPLNWEAKDKMDSFKAAYEDETTQVRQQALSAREVAWTESSMQPTPPYIMLRYTSESGQLPRDPHSLTLDEQWFRTVFGEDIRRKLITYDTSPSELPEFKCSTAYLVVYTKEKSGRMIALDVGPVPEFVWFAEVYAVDLDANTRMKLPGRVYGPSAKKPVRKLGGGVRRISSLTGEMPSNSSVQEHIHSTVKR